ncbi:hypothetical protein HYW59_03975 [Candidatus Kaiserbacteria bacterium]|nr:hypothetical protein [Candidatus Kaiserbacteria bacterium]
MIESLVKERDDFEKQFKRITTLELPGRSNKPNDATVVQVIEVAPPQEKITNPRRLVFATAFVHVLKAYKPLLHALYSEGRSTLTFDHPRAGGVLPDLPQDEYEAVKDFLNNESERGITAPEEVRAARILLDVLASRNEVQVDMLTHSRGFGYSVVAALIDNVRAKKEGRLNRIRNIVASGPNGLMGEDTMYEVAKRALAEDTTQINFGPDFGHPSISMDDLAYKVAMDRLEKVQKGELPIDTEIDATKIREELEKMKARAKARGITEYGPPDTETLESIKEAATLVDPETYILGREDARANIKKGLFSYLSKESRQGIKRSLREWAGLSRVKLNDILPKLRELDIGIAIVRGTDDKVFPSERIALYMKTLREFGILDIQMTAVHDSVNRDPRVAHILNGVFTQLEQQRSLH